MEKTQTNHFPIAGSDSLSIPREITYDSSLEQLLSAPVQELAGLRGDTIGAITSPTTVQPSAPLALVKPAAPTATLSYDMTADFALPSASTFLVQLSLLSAGPNPAHDETALLFSISATAPSAPTGSRNATVFQCSCDSHGCCNDPNARTYTFALPPGQASINVRVLVDVNVAELFVADGRAAYTTSAHAGSPGQSGVYITAPDAPVRVNNASVWSMGCGWA